jgi:RimJ/RimL family protein N-acetyltransferase
MSQRRLATHDLVLEGTRVTLRPLTEDDWETLLRWNSDPEVLYYSEGDDVESYSLEEVQRIYRGISQSALCFMIEIDGEPIGECWLQRMNLDRILERYAGVDCRRIDLMIGEKELWGRGYGPEAIKQLTDYAFEVESADLVFGCDIGDYNVRSRRAFEKCGFALDTLVPAQPGAKAAFNLDLVIAAPR